MNLYYTVSSQPEAIQMKPQLSLGGYKSSVKLRNSQLGNLFGDITPFTISNNNQNQYIGLVLKNETGGDITGVKLYFTYPTDSYSLFRVAAVDMFTGSDSNLQMEHIGQITIKPLTGEFFEADGVANQVDLGDLTAGEQIGVWIERELKLDDIKVDQDKVYELVPGYTDRYQEVELNKLDDIKLNISWT